MTSNDRRSDATWLARVVQERLDQNQAPGGNRPWAGFLASVRTGLTPSGDLWAHQVTARFTAGLSERQARGARRAAAMRAISKDVEAFRPYVTEADQEVTRLSVGSSLSSLYRAENATYPGDKDSKDDQIVDQVGMLPLLDLDEAALVLHTLIGRCAGAMVTVGDSRRPVTVDFSSLARTLVYWGDGVSEASVRTRTQLVSDFYGYRPN